jgi:tetratricopeptide (TPR) repeat protein
VFYPFPFRPGVSLSPVFFLYPLVLGVFLGITLFAFRKLYKEAVFGLSFFFICILLVLLINNYRETIITDRYTYLASIGMYLFLAWTGLQLSKRFPFMKVLLIVLASVYVLGFAYLTFERNRLWHSPSRLMGSALSLYPGSPVLLNTLGSLAIDSGNNALALEYLNKAVSVDGKFAQARYNRGIAETKTDMYQYAIRDFSIAIQLNPHYADAFFGRGNAYRITGDYLRAMKDYSYVLYLDPGYFGAWENRAIVKGNLKDFKGAVGDLDQAIRINPAFGASWFLRGIARFELGQNGCDDLHRAVFYNYEPAMKALEFYCK